MRAAALILVATAGPALAQPDLDAPMWSAETRQVRGHVSHDTVALFERTGPGAWNVQFDCQVTDTRSKRWTSHKSVGQGRLHQGFIVGVAGPLGRFILAGDRLSVDSDRCASDVVTFGTGD
ncbi:hypothetical protein ACFOYU_11760 [Microvirga sp. GCM10011540]|uniref:hypothetical protein n=1 Tax=Microvirga sp. GCM10011540 TaxID=3317338 RepID=UPI00361D5107